MRFRGDFYSPGFLSQACRRHSPPAEAPTANNNKNCIINSIHSQWDGGGRFFRFVPFLFVRDTLSVARRFKRYILLLLKMALQVELAFDVHAIVLWDSIQIRFCQNLLHEEPKGGFRRRFRIGRSQYGN